MSYAYPRHMEILLISHSLDGREKYSGAVMIVKGKRVWRLWFNKSQEIFVKPPQGDEKLWCSVADSRISDGETQGWKAIYISITGCKPQPKPLSEVGIHCSEASSIIPREKNIWETAHCRMLTHLTTQPILSGVQKHIFQSTQLFVNQVCRTSHKSEAKCFDRPQVAGFSIGHKPRPLCLI